MRSGKGEKKNKKRRKRKGDEDDRNILRERVKIMASNKKRTENGKRGISGKENEEREENGEGRKLRAISNFSKPYFITVV